MEKYAVDLDKVLDELEFNEDRAEQLASALSKRTANGATPHIGYGPAARKSSVPSMHYRRPAFEPINLADADFAAAPQPSASYVESSYTPQVIAHHEGRHSGSHWQQNGVSTPHIGAVFSSLNEYVGDNKNDLKNHPSSLWIQNNLVDSRNVNKGKSEKRNGSLDVFISNVTLNSGGHVSECSTTDGLYYNEINKLGETIGESNVSRKQDIKSKRDNLSAGVSGSRMYEEYLSNNVIKSEIISGTPSVLQEPYSTNADGLECQTSESSVLGVDISCEAEGLECNSSNPCKEQNSVNYVRVAENNNLENEVLGFVKISENGGCDSTEIDTQVADSEEKLPANNANEVIDQKQVEVPGDAPVDSVCNTVTSKNVLENLPEENNEMQNIIGTVTSAIGFTSFADISDEELQQYLQELEEEVGNEMDSLAVGTIAVQESVTGNISACVGGPTANEEQSDVSKEIRRDYSEDLEKYESKVSSNCGIYKSAKIHESVSEVTRACDSDSARTAISDVSVVPSDTEPPISTVLAAVPGPTVLPSVVMSSQPPSTLQESIGTAPQDSASELTNSALSASLSITTPSGVACVPDKDTRKNYEPTQAVRSSEAGDLISSMENVLSCVTFSKPLSSVLDPVSANNDVSAALILYVSSTTDAVANNNGLTASCSGTTDSQLIIPSTAQGHHDSHLPQSTVTVPQSSDVCTVSNVPAASADDDLPADIVSSSSSTVVDISAKPVSSTDKPSSTITNTSFSVLQQVQISQQENEEPPQSESSVKECNASGKAERTLNNGKTELLSEVIAASPPSYQSVIDASKYECLGGTDKYVSQENNPFPRSEVNVCTVKTPEEGSSIDVLGEEERPSRPHFLHLPSKINLDDQNVDPVILESPPAMLTYGPPGETPSATPHLSLSDNLGSEGTVSSPDLSDTSSVEQVPSDSSDMVSPEDRTLGKLPPYWVPDADAPSCMLCDIKFTVLKRRHHCRACGKVLCSKCCNLKFRLEYLDNTEARVCQPCFGVLARVYAVEQCESASGSLNSAREANAGINAALGRRPNPNNPMEYCSTIPPLEQAASALRQPPPSVLVPVGVLKREGSARSKSDVTKQVMFSDGIRPGGDLTELDGSSEPRMPYRRPGRILKRVGTPPGVLPVTPSSQSSQPKAQPVMDPKTNSFIPEKGLPPVVTLLNGEVRYEEDYESTDKLMATMKSETELPVVFALNRNFFVQVKIVNLDCCVNRTCWCFSTLGLRCVGQDEVMVVLECQQGETTVPQDMYLHLNSLYQEASRGVTVGELGYTVVQRSNFLGSSDYSGFIYVRPSFQCLHKLVLPAAPYLVGILIHRWETPWARLFPIRLMLRLGAEFRYYPCMLVSIRQRKPVYCEIGHTIMNLLADFRNLSYTLPSVRGLVIHMEDRQTSVLFPKNRYDQVMRALSNSNDHVLAFAANFSQQADSHLVCIQGTEDESYHTQAINIHTKPRKVTGASFVVFNGALKSSLNLTAKSSIVEDGLMVQITADDMVHLRTALRNMVDFTIGCGPCGASAPDERVLIIWEDDDKNFNIGVRSCIDGQCLDGVPSIRVHNGTDYVGSSRFIRWTEVFIIQSEDSSGQSGDPLDISRLSESIAQATCLALVQLLDSLAQAGVTVLAVRADIHPDSVGYEVGSGGERLAPLYMNSLDNELVPVLHKAASSASDSPAAILELVFHIMMQ